MDSNPRILNRTYNQKVIHVDFKSRYKSEEVIDDVVRAYRLNHTDRLVVEHITNSCHQAKDAKKLLVALLGKSQSVVSFSRKLNGFYGVLCDLGVLTKRENPEFKDNLEGLTTKHVEKLVSFIENTYKKSNIY